MPGIKFRHVHLYTFRIVLATSIFLLWAVVPFYSDWKVLGVYGWLQVALCCEVFLHHTFSLFPQIAAPNLFDLALVLAELSVWFTLLGRFPKAFEFDPWAPQSYSIYLISMHTQIVVLIILLGCRIYRLVGAERVSPFAQYDFGIPWRPVLFGESLFKLRYQNEPSFHRFLRAVIAYLFICGLIVYSLFVLVVGPVQETAFPPVKTFRGSRLLKTQFSKLDPFVWRIFVASRIFKSNKHYLMITLCQLVDTHTAQASNITAADLRSSINITVLWDHDEGDSRLSMRSDSVNFIKFRCPRQYDTPPTNSPDEEYVKFYDNSNLAPDLLITVNFTSLNITSKSLANARRRAVSFLVGLTEDDPDVTSNTIPTPLFPGSHVHASVSRQVRQIATPRFLASLGTFAFSRTFLTAQLSFLASDPSPLIDRQENTATLRIYTQNDPSDWTVVQDYRENYVLDGLADIGGFWAFVNGLFMAFFGSTLAMIILGVKQFTVFGVLDRLAKKKLRKDFHKKYPKLREEAAPDQRGLLALLRDHFIDLEILNSEETDTPNPTPTGSPHPGMAQQGGPLTV
ncbi:hypothetical protein BDZ94DRAFT_1301531 [Collybia nuda]|uniref:Uncharacterized protein n=1 Tax=Collybia nuda TaxID=64659 RepID=A0A9P5XYH8_9AGAR|nr:hypothetical protein BDZ94DRAFT_1301531 [Collybia nuda]